MVKFIKKWWLFNLVHLSTIILLILKFTDTLTLSILQVLIPSMIWAVLVLLAIVVGVISGVKEINQKRTDGTV